MDGNVLWCSSREYIRASSFLLYINDFPLSVSCSTELFADDSVLYRKIASEDDCVEFQDDLLSAASWCQSLESVRPYMLPSLNAAFSPSVRDK